MKIKLDRLNNHLHFEAVNSKNLKVQIDGPGDDEKGLRPMELMLAAVASCSSFDVVEILKKQKQNIENISVSAIGERPTEGYPKPFKKIHLTFKLQGKIDPKKVQRAIELSLTKYCSASASLDPNIQVDYQFEISA
ncbi:MAG: OsmC family protein [Flavobacteriales bacterium]|nr:OsmC family protein [Flavobacteriales bacterium]